MVPSWPPKSFRNQQNTDAKIDQKFDASRDRFLARIIGFWQPKWSYVDLQIIKKSISIAKNVFLKNHCFSMKNHLRDKVIIEEIEYNESLSKEEYTKSDHKPNLIAKKLYLETKKLYDNKHVSGNIYITVDDQIKELTDVVGKCERIKKTPIPYSYNIFLKKFIFIYTFTLPLGLATTFFYWSIPISIFTLYILASLELLAEEIENPFGEDANDLPVDVICQNIKKNVDEILNKNH